MALGEGRDCRIAFRDIRLFWGGDVVNMIQELLDNTLKKHNRHNRYIAVLTALSLFVSVIVSSILIMPADSKAGSRGCSLTEHTHTEECKSLICGFEQLAADSVENDKEKSPYAVAAAEVSSENSGQSSEESIISEDQEASDITEVFDIPETSEASEYEENTSQSSAEQPADTEGAVSVEETKHVHTDECYTYICGLEEHVHSEECYEAIEFGSEQSPEEYQQNLENNEAFGVFSVFGKPLHMVYNDPMLLDIATNPAGDSDSLWQANPGAILGLANNFHIFAEEVALRSHVHGNLATNLLTECGAFGVYSNRLAGKSSVNYIRELGAGVDLANAYGTQLVLGNGYVKSLENVRFCITKEETGYTTYIPVDKFGGDMELDQRILIEEPYKPYINISRELDYFSELSRKIAARPDSAGVSVVEDGENYTLDFTDVTDKYIYYMLDLSGYIEMSTCSKVLHIKGLDNDKFLFLTVHVGGEDTDSVAFSKSWRVYDENGNAFETGEVPLDAPNCRVIYNFVNSRTDDDGSTVYVPFGESEDGLGTDAQIVLGESKNGTFLVPRGYVNAAGNTNGTIIAYKFVATGESHRNDIQFEGTELEDVDWQNPVYEDENNGDTEEKPISITINKMWNDGNDNHTGDNITVALYKAYEPRLSLENVNEQAKDINGNVVQDILLNSSGNWQGVFSELPVRDNDKLIYYYVKEVERDGYKAEYSSNGLNTIDRKVTIRNVKHTDITVEKQWYDSQNNRQSGFASEIRFRLYKSSTKLDNNIPVDRVQVGDETFLSTGRETFTFYDLPTEENGNTIYYYVEETAGHSDYNVTYENNAYNINSSGNIIIKNTKKKDSTISLTVTKQWNASEIPGIVDYVSPVGQYNIPVRVTLRHSTDNTNWTDIASAEFTTSYTFTNLPKKDINTDTAYYYRVVEDSVYGYKAVYTYNGSSGNTVYAGSINDNETAVIQITNELIKNSLTVNKIWKDNIRDGISSVAIEVYRKLAGKNPEIDGGDNSTGENNNQGSGDSGNNNNQGSGDVNVDGNTVTVEPENSSYGSVADLGDRVWYYTIPDDYKDKTISSVKLTFDENGSYNGRIIVARSVSNNEFKWDYTVTSDTFTTHVMNYNIVNGYYLDPELQSDYSIYYIDYTGNQGNIQKIEITFEEAVDQLSILNYALPQTNTMFALSQSYNQNQILSLTADDFVVENMGSTRAFVCCLNYFEGKTIMEADVTLTNPSGVSEFANNNEILIHNTNDMLGSSKIFKTTNALFEPKREIIVRNGQPYKFIILINNEGVSVEKVDIAFDKDISNIPTGAPTFTQSEKEHNFTINGKLSSFYNINGTLYTSKGSVWNNNTEYKYCLGLEDDTTISFTTSKPGRLKLFFNYDPSSVKIDDQEKSVSGGNLITDLAAGEHTIKKAGEGLYLYYMNYEDSDSDPVIYNGKTQEFKKAGEGYHNDNADILYVENDNDFRPYKNKILKKFEVHYRDASCIASDGTNNADWFGIHKISSQWQSSSSYDLFESSSSSSGNITTYTFNDIAVNEFYENGFFRIKTYEPAAIEKIVFYFSDSSTYTLTNKVYSSTAPDTPSVPDTPSADSSKTLVLYRHNFVEEDRINIDSQMAWVYYLKDFKGKTIKSVKITFTERTSGDNYSGRVLIYQGNAYENYDMFRDYSTPTSPCIQETDGCVVNEEEDYKLIITRFTDKGNDYELDKVEITFAEDISSITPSDTVHEYETVEFLKYSLSDNLLGDNTYMQYEGSYNEQRMTHKFSGVRGYLSKKVFERVEVHYRSTLTGFPDRQSDTGLYMIYTDPGTNSDSSFETESFRLKDNVAIWYYKNPAGITAESFKDDFLYFKSTRSAEISRIVIGFTDGSTYTIKNTVYEPTAKVEGIGGTDGDYTYNNGEYVLIGTIVLDENNNWTYIFDGLPATNGKGQAYSYHIKETSINGSRADKYELVSYSDDDGVVLEKLSNNIGVTNGRKQDENTVLLPSTGGTGAKGYYIAGIVMIVCSVSGYQFVKRRHKYQR